MPRGHLAWPIDPGTLSRGLHRAAQSAESLHLSKGIPPLQPQRAVSSSKPFLCGSPNVTWIAVSCYSLVDLWPNRPLPDCNPDHLDA